MNLILYKNHEFLVYLQALSMLSKLLSLTARISLIVNLKKGGLHLVHSGAIILRWFSHHSDYGFLRKYLTDNVVGKNHLEVSHESRNIRCLEYFSKNYIDLDRINFGLFPTDRDY